MALHIRDSETDALVRELARKKGLGLTQAVKLAVREELTRESDAVPLRDRIAKLRDELASWPSTGQPADKAFFDDLSGVA
jgi:antitoxin VapB